MDSVVGYTVLPGELAKNLDNAKEFLTASGITGAVVLRVLGKEEQLRTEMPGTAWYSGAYYHSFWNYWGYSWGVVYSIGPVQSDTVVSIEALVYSISQIQLIWASRSETVNPKEIRKFVHQIVDAAGKEMRKAGLVEK